MPRAISSLGISLCIATAMTRPAASDDEFAFFLADGSPVALQLVSDEMVLEPEAGTEPGSIRRLMRRQFAPAASAPRSIAPEGRFLAIDLGTSRSAATWRKEAEGLRASGAVRNVYPVFVHRPSGHRLTAADEVLARIADGATLDDVLTHARPLRLRVIDRMPFDERIVRMRIEAPRPFDSLEVSNSLRRADLVEWAEPNFRLQLRRAYIPNDSEFARQWHLHNTGQTGGLPDADIDAPEAWDITRGRPDVVIAILDDGLDLNHVELKDNIFTNPGEVPGNQIDDDDNGLVDDVRGWDFYGNDNDAGGDDWFYDYHATPVAGLAGAVADNNLGVVGVAPGCKILPCRILGQYEPTVEQVARAIQYAGRMADVLSMSWTASPNNTLAASLLHASKEGRRGLGSVLCASTGNDPTLFGIGFPASLEYVIGVGASTYLDVRAPYSNYAEGFGVFVLAPSSEQQGRNGVFTIRADNRFGWFSGTSASAPEVAGACALVVSVAPTLTRPQVETALRETADKIDPSAAGYDAGGYSPTHGYGRLNLHRALLRAAADLAPTAFDFQPEIVARQGALHFSGDVKNLGHGPGTWFWVEFWLSRSNQFAALDTMACPSIPVPSLLPGETLSLDSVSANLFLSVGDGLYRLGVVVDRVDNQIEADESNNTLYVAHRLLQVGAGSTDVDLVVADLDFTPLRVDSGTSITLQGHVLNRGAQLSHGVWVEFWVSPDPLGDRLAYLLCDPVKTHALGPGERFDLAAVGCTVYAPPLGPPEGRYRVGVVIDRPNEQTETEEKNNRVFQLDKWLTIGNATGARSWHLYQ